MNNLKVVSINDDIVNAPDWLIASFKDYADNGYIEYLYDYNDISHVLLCGNKQMMLSDDKSIRNNAKIPLNIDNNVYKWTDSSFPKLDRNTLISKIRQGHLIGIHPGSFDLFVFDVDEGDYKQVINICGEPICVLSTPSGGKHIYYRKPEGIGHVKNLYIKDYINGVSGEIRCDAGYVLVYSPRELVMALQSNLSSNEPSYEFITKLNGNESKRGVQISSYDINDGINRFKKSKAGERNNVGNAMIWRDAYYDLLNSNQQQKYIDAAKDNGMPMDEILSLIKKCAQDAKAKRDAHFNQFRCYPTNTAIKSDTGEFLYDKNSITDKIRVINSVVADVRHEVRGDKKLFKYDLKSKWLEFDDDSPFEISEKICSDGYYYSTKHSDYPSSITKEEVRDCLSSRLKHNKVDVIKDYLLSLKGTWDGKDRFANMMPTIFNCHGSELLTKKTEIMMIGLVNRILNPGCKFDYMFFFKGGQGIGKSTFLQMMFPKNIRQYAVSSRINLKDGDQKMLESSAGACIILFDEMFSRSVRDKESLKSLITQTQITYRKPYQRMPNTTNVSWILCATTNDNQFIQNDPTGARRYILFCCDEKNELDKQRNGFLIEKYYDENRDQLFAQAVDMLSGYDFTFSNEQMERLNNEREIHRQKDYKWEVIVDDMLKENILKHRQLWSIVQFEAGLISPRPGIQQPLGAGDIRRAFEQGQTAADLGLYHTGSSFDRENLKTALEHHGYVLKNGRSLIKKEDGGNKVALIVYKKDGDDNV